MLCAVIKNPSLKKIAQANRKADVIELRLDSKPSIDEVKAWRRACEKPVIFTGGDTHYLSCMPDYVDVPFGEKWTKVDGIKTICSFHDFKGFPSRLERIFSQPADLYKIAVTPSSTVEALRLLHFAKYSSKPLIAIGLGEVGSFTRVLAPVVGAPFMYAPLDEQEKNAPGQILLDELRSTYNYQRLNERTALFGLIGDPVDKSRSHQTHNFAFKKWGLNCAYVKMRVQKEELKEFFSLARGLGFHGFSVTMPLKEATFPYLHSQHHDSGAINTIAIKNGQLEGWNTDGIGAVTALEKKISLFGKKMVILGAGGVSKAIAREALKKGASITIVNRTFTKAKEFAQRWGLSALSLEEFERIAEKDYDILVNGTSVGMEDEQCPITESAILKKALVMETISRETPLIRAARKKGCEVIEGFELFIQQAVEQFCLWFTHTALADRN